MIVRSGVSIINPVRRRLSRESSDRQTLQRHPIIGTPTEVPVPKKVIRIVERGTRLPPERNKLHFQIGKQLLKINIFAPR